MGTNNRWPWWLILVVAGTGIVLGGVMASKLFPPDPPEPVYLPADTVTVEVVPQEFLDELASTHSLNSDLKLTADGLRDENGRLVQVIDRLKVQTKPEVAPEPVVSIIKEACEDEAVATLVYRAGMEAFRFRGLDDEGAYTYGWRGTVCCEMSPDGTQWSTLVREPFSLSDVQAVTTEAPEPVRRPVRYVVGIHYGLLLNSSTTVLFDSTYGIPTSLSPNRFRVFGARNFWPKSRHPIGLGVFADTDSAGVHMSYSF